MSGKKKKEFTVNEYISLKLERNKTNIYVGGELFNQCKYVLLRKIVYEIEDFLEDIDSVDDLAEYLDHSLEGPDPEPIDIPPETRFWVHCSNMQVWAENNYDTRSLHRNLAFPLLKRLTEIGVPLAKKVFKKEVAKRFTTCHYPVMKFLIREEYLESFSYEEFITMLTECIRHAQQDSSLAKALSKVLIEHGYMLMLYYKSTFKIDDLNNPLSKFFFQIYNKILVYSNVLTFRYTKRGLFNDLITILEFKHEIHIKRESINNSEEEFLQDTPFLKKIHELKLAIEWIFQKHKEEFLSNFSTLEGLIEKELLSEEDSQKYLNIPILFKKYEKLINRFNKEKRI